MTPNWRILGVKSLTKCVGLVAWCVVVRDFREVMSGRDARSTGSGVRPFERDNSLTHVDCSETCVKIY